MKSPVQTSNWHGKHFTLAGFVRATATLPYGAQTLDALVPDRHGLGPPVRHVVGLVHEPRDLPVRPLMSAGPVQLGHPMIPPEAGSLLDDGVGHTGQFAVIRCRFRRGKALLLSEELSAGGGVSFARLLHAGANEALEILVGRHRSHPLVRPRARSPAAAPRGDAKELTMVIREYAPLCLVRDPGWGRVIEVGRGPAPGRLACSARA